ncbi:hypothetical protein LCGC14_2287890 [marine sediment metagenome]|uniref:Uncharacterized protein n=1 Tax=marine sediment metagenome TaxID=412755 RepID=A0A0F9CRY1_9ZZZZ
MRISVGAVAKCTVLVVSATDDASTKRFFCSTASPVLTRTPIFFEPKIEPLTPIIKKKRGKYWESPKYKFKGK